MQETLPKKRILALGNPVYDRINTPLLVREDRVLSGCSTNACLAVTRLGETGVLVGTVGPDYETRLAADLAHFGIAGRLFPSRQTGGFQLIYDERGDRDLDVLGIADPIPFHQNGASPYDFVLLGPILGEISVDLVRSLKSEISAPFLLDPQGTLRRIEDGRVTHALTGEFTEIAGLSTIVKANELEGRIVTGIDPRVDPEGCVRALRAVGCEIAIVTLAEAGSIIFDGEQIVRIPAFRTIAVDPTGAGDTYAAGFMVRYLETPDDLAVCGCFASAVASVMVENSGPDFPLTRAEADRRADQLLDGFV
ncbi:MAG TPA: PfkB family carbohydrate kinase [Anaerolineales bacterium]|nr:PfkB family carbohydrate kinase [Anaerolineales bacterium]